MKVSLNIPKSNLMYKDINRAITDVRLGISAGNKLAIKQDKSCPYRIGYGALSTYRNLKASNNIMPALFSCVCFIVPFYGTQIVGFLFAKKLQRTMKSDSVQNLINSAKYGTKRIARSILK